MPPIQLSLSVPFTQITLHLPAYGIFFSLAFLSAIWLAHLRAPSADLDPDRMGDLYVVIIISAVVGARALFVWLEWRRFARHPLEALQFWRGGLVFFGGLIGAVAGSLIYIRRTGLSVLGIADLAGPSLALGQAVGRLGCFSNGCCFGSVTNLPWACRAAGTDALLRHPTQLYEGAGLVAITVVLLLASRRSPRPGAIAVGYLSMGAVLRFLVEILRDDDRGGFFAGGLSISQLISIGTFALGLVGAAWLVARGRRSDSTIDPAEVTP